MFVMIIFEVVVCDIDCGLCKGWNVIYIVFIWWLIMIVIKLILEFVFKKLLF